MYKGNIDSMFQLRNINIYSKAVEFHFLAWIIHKYFNIHWLKWKYFFLVLGTVATNQEVKAGFLFVHNQRNLLKKRTTIYSKALLHDTSFQCRMIELFHKRLPDWHLSGCNIKKALHLTYGLQCCDRLWMSSPQKVSGEGGILLCLWPETRAEIQFCFSAQHSHHFQLRSSMGFKCIIFVWIHRSQWKQIFWRFLGLSIVLVPTNLSTGSVDLKYPWRLPKWNSGIQWSIAAT